MPNFFDRAKEAVGLTQPQEPEPEEESLADSLCPKLTYQQRIMGFAICFLLGYLITFASFHRLVELVEGNPLPFASMYTLGNILALFSSMFLCGPARQLKLMMDEKRKVTAIIYVSCLIATIVVIFIPMQQLAKLLIIFILVLTQMASGLWYNLSYIPFGRRTFIKCFKNLVGVGDDGGGGGVLGGTSSRTLGV